MTPEEAEAEAGAAPGPTPAQSRRWILQALGWDGAMPLAVAVLPEILVALPLWKGRAALIVAGAVLATGLGRAHIACRELERAGHSTLPWWRQILLAVAICLLMMVELTFGIGVVIEGMPIWPGILIVLGEYLAYLSLILIALRPERRLKA